MKTEPEFLDLVPWCGIPAILDSHPLLLPGDVAECLRAFPVDESTAMRMVTSIRLFGHITEFKEANRLPPKIESWQVNAEKKHNYGDREYTDEEKAVLIKSRQLGMTWSFLQNYGNLKVASTPRDTLNPFNLSGTSTGRFRSREPNLSNIPKGAYDEYIHPSR